jgi:ABC-type nitrate/sulfonate/bicarbonate transport system substrate-binding protein
VLDLLVSEGGARTADEVVASHGPNVHRSFTPKLTDDYVRGLEVQKDFLRDHGYLKADFDVRSWIVREPLAEAQKLVAREPKLFEAPAEPSKARSQTVRATV